MKKIFSATLFGLISFPIIVLAQSDGMMEPVQQDPAVVTQEKAAAEPVAQAQTQPAPAAPRPAPTQTAPAAAVETAPAPESEPVPLEAMQEVVELAAENAPKAMQPWLSALAGALGAAALIFGAQAAMKKAAQKNAKTCAQCKGTGRAGDCVTCKGTKEIEEEKEETLECPKCEGEGEGECARCEGEGGTGTMSCSPCKGEGTVDCQMCRGLGKAELTMKKKATCPDCA